MSDMKTLAESIDMVNRNLGEYRKAAEENTAAIAKFGQDSEDAKSKLVAMERDIADALGAITEVKRRQALGTAHGPIVDMSPEEVTAKNAWITAIRKGDNDAFRGMDSKAREIHEKALSTLVAPDGGFWVPKDMTGRMVAKLQDASPLRRYANVQNISTNALSGPIDNQEAEAGWTSEMGARNETATPKTGMWEIPAHEMYAEPKSTQTLLDDAAYDVDSWLTGKLADRFARLESLAFISGNGTGKPKGILSQTFVTDADSSRAWGKVQYRKTGVNGGFAAAPNAGDVLIDLMTDLRSQYWNGAIWAMNRFTLAKVMQLKDSDGKFLWLPDFSKGAQGLLLGLPVDAGFDHMPNPAANGYSIAFGNFREAYQIVDRQGIRILRDALTAKPFVKFYATRRTGGDVVNYEAYKVLKFAA